MFPQLSILCHTFLETIMATPWVMEIGSLALIAYYPLPSISRKNFPKFLGDGKVTIDGNIKVFFTVTHILGVSHKEP